MKLFNRVAIIGTGLIGGSLALDIKEKKLADKIIGISRHRETLKLAKERGIIDTGSKNLSIIKGADLLILAAPVNTIIKLAFLAAKYVNKDCLVIDVGSTKAKIVSELTGIFPNFVGCHPLAGSEKRGITNATTGIFNNSLCIITPSDKTSPAALKKSIAFWKRIGSKISILDPFLHDKTLSSTSHLPHIIAFSLINTIPKNFLKFAPLSLKEMTRIASSDSAIWAEIFLSNRTEVLRSIRLFEQELAKLHSAIKGRKEKRIIRLLNNAKRKRGFFK